ncbi:MAG: hypothetical protein OEZ22_05840 [Spirochaetia bacterium]|nr:hypothetical protein [Spirochaetia bacterium]
MIKDIVIKKDNGSYGFSTYGESMSYFFTMRQLLSHYMTQVLHAEPAVTQNKINTLKAFTDKNFTKLEDYLEKLNLLAEYIGESDEARFSSFLGRYFLSSLEKTKAKLYQTELPKAKDKFDNPFRAVSNSFLEAYGTLFMKAAPLKIKIEVQDAEEDINEPQENYSQVHSNNATNNNQNQYANNEKAAPIIEENKSILIPGSILLDGYEKLFNLAPPLKLERENKEEFELNVELSKDVAQENKLEAAALEEKIIPEEPQKPKDTRLPGQILIEKEGAEFQHSRPLVLKKETTVNTEQNNDLLKIPRQTLLKHYVSLGSTVSKYMKVKDSEGYQKWYSTLSPVHKLTLNLNNHINKVLRHEQVNWQEVFNQLSKNYKVSVDIIKKVKQETEAYSEILKAIQNILKQTQARGLNAHTAQQMYSQLITLYENKDTTSIKQSELKIILLQIMDEGLKDTLSRDLLNLLSIAKEKYPLE